jgi:Glyoxalase/Bleomycin resistance protein/Dioxygenase superfamily
MTFGPQTNYHTGFVVADLEEAVVAFAAPLSVRFMPITTADVAVVIGSERHELRIRFVYSIDEGHHVELIESIPGTTYECPPDQAVLFHHLGYWTSDVTGDGERLVESGFPSELAITPDGAPGPSIAYHRHAHGLRVELVDARALEAMERAWAKLRGRS